MSNYSTVVERMSVVQRVLDPDRKQTETDILIESMVVALENGSLTRDALCHRVHELWPGAQISGQALERSIDVALKNGIVAKTPSGDGEQLALVVHSPDSKYESIAERVLERSRDQIRDYFSDEYERELTYAEADRLLTVLLDMLGAGIRQAFAPYEGAVKQVSDDTVIPDSYDIEAMYRILDDAPINDGLKPGLRALCLAAIDISCETGTELVTQLATGYVLHAFLARQDQQDDINVVGTLAREWLLLDTPILFTLLSRYKASRALRTTIRLARDAGVQIVIPEACVAEYRSLIESATGIAEGVSTAYVTESIL